MIATQRSDLPRVSRLSTSIYCMVTQLVFCFLFCSSGRLARADGVCFARRAQFESGDVLLMLAFLKTTDKMLKKKKK